MTRAQAPTRCLSDHAFNGLVANFAAPATKSTKHTKHTKKTFLYSGCFELRRCEVDASATSWMQRRGQEEMRIFFVAFVLFVAFVVRRR